MISRADDERLLKAVALRAQGLSGSQIVERLGGTRGAWTRATNAVLDADLAHLDPLASSNQIRRAYW